MGVSTRECVGATAGLASNASLTKQHVGSHITISRFDDLFDVRPTRLGSVLFLVLALLACSRGTFCLICFVSVPARALTAGAFGDSCYRVGGKPA